MAMIADRQIDRPQTESRPLIVHVTRQFAPSRGGLEDVVGNLARQLVRRGYKVRIVTLNSVFAAPELRPAAHETVDGIEIVRIPWSGSTRYPLGPQVFRHLSDADIIHVHAIDFFFDALAWGRFLHRKPMVVTTHGGFFHTPKYAAIKKVWFRTLTRASALAYQRLICCSQSDFQLFSQIASNRIVTIENGANTEKFADRAARTPQKRIVTIGRFSVNKRLDRLLDTMRALTHRDNGWHLDVIGIPSDLSVADLQGEVRTRGLTSQVTLHAGIPDTQIADLLGQASFFASASEYEGFGLVAVEAMSAGLVPVLHGNEAYRMLAGRHPNIRLADFTDADSTATTILSAYEAVSAPDSRLRADVMHEAETYSWNSVADRYVDVYEAVLREGRR